MAEPDDLWAAMLPTLSQNHGFVLATVISTTSSAPRPAGTQMAVLDDGTVIGSLSGGCVEGDVYARSAEVASTGEPLLQDYGYSDDTAFSVGLTCGGSIRVYLERVEPREFGFYRRLAAHVQAGESVATITALTGPDTGWRTIVDPDETPRASQLEGQARHMLRQRVSGLTVSAQDRSQYFVRSYGAPAQMVVFGSNAFAAALVRLATTVGYRVTVCDARQTFTTRARFPEADEIVVQWPHEYLAELAVDHRTVLCAMTHDPKFDDPLLVQALQSPAQFIGAMGSRRTSADRFERLRQLGVTEQDLARLHAPFGLDLGAATPEETAVSMLAEIVSTRQGGSNLPLRQLWGPIHESQRLQPATSITSEFGETR